MATTVVRSTDSAAVSAGAILTGNAGSLVAVLDYALVTVLGWSKAFTATNKGVYRAPAGVRHYLDVDDSAPDATALGRNARIRGYETMSAVGTGTGPFPTTTMAATCVGIVKSTATGTTARPWLLIGDDRTFYLFVESAGTDPPNLATHTWTGCMYFGEILSVNTGDLYRTFIGWQSPTTATVSASNAALSMMTTAIDTGGANQNMPRSYTGAGSCIWTGSFPCTGLNNGGAVLGGQFSVFPNPADGGVYLNAFDILERGTGAGPASAATSGAGFGGFRGRWRGFYQTPYGNTGYNDQDTFTGAGDFAGRSFLILKLPSAMIVAETSAWLASS